MQLRLNTNAVVTDKNGKILLVELKGGPFKGGLCIPGGGTLLGEFSQDTARREVMEETGIDVASEFVPFGFCELMDSGIRKHRVVLLVHAEAEGEPKTTREGYAGWYTLEEAEQNLIPFAREALRIWKNKEIHFRLAGEDVGVRAPENA